jgi:hypothetical protein
MKNNTLDLLSGASFIRDRNLIIPYLTQEITGVAQSV